MASEYRVYGLTLRSSRALPHLRAAPKNGVGSAVDVRFDVGDGLINGLPDAGALEWTAVRNRRFPPEQRMWYASAADGVFLRMRYEGTIEGARGALEFLIDPSGRNVWSTWSESSPVKSIHDATTLLLGPVMGRVLRLLGRVSLHACVVEVGRRSAVLLGSRGMGKSTTAAALAQRGHPVLSDDLAAVTCDEPEDGGASGGTWSAQPGYPCLRLLPGTIDALAAPAGDRPVLTGVDKRFLDLSPEDRPGAWRFRSTPLPLAAIYLLQRDHHLDAPAIEPIAGAARLATLLAHRSAGFAPLGGPVAAREFSRFRELSSAVDVRRVRCPHGLDRLDELCDAIVEDAAQARGGGCD